jgi:hypothetical protein
MITLDRPASPATRNVFMRFAVCTVLLLAFALGTGCRHAPPPAEQTGHSSFRFVDQPVGPPPASSGEIVQPTNRSQWHEATLKEPVPIPVYPAKAIEAKAGRNTVGVRIVVDPEGRVIEIRMSMLVFSTPGPFAEDFRDAVEVAVRQWRFNPARSESFEIIHDGEATDIRVTGVENVETEFDLAFTFQPDGAVQMGN